MNASPLVGKLAYATIPLFWPAFLATVALTIYLAKRIPIQRRSPEPFGAASLPAVIACLAPLLALILWNADFTYYDNDIFTEHLAAGRWRPLAIWPLQGRYFPLFAQDLNVVSLFGSSALLFYGETALELIALCWLLTIALRDLPAPFRYGTIAVIALSNSVGLVYADPLAPERNVVLCLAILIVALQRADRTPSRLNHIVAVLAAQVGVYYQEPTFLAIAAVAITRLALARRRAAAPARHYRMIDLGLLAICAIFATQLLTSLLVFEPGPAVDRVNRGFLHTAWWYLRTDFLLLPFAAALIARLARLRRFDELDPVWDAFAFGAVAYLVAVWLMGLPNTRSAAPVDLIAGLIIAREAARFTATTAAVRRLAVSVASAAVAAAVVLAGALRFLEHKSVAVGTSRLAHIVEQYAAQRPGDVRLYFPVTQGWRIMNVAAYFHHRGGVLASRVHMTAPRQFPDDRCAAYVPYVCRESAGPAPGDLIVTLADDTEPVSNGQGTLLLRFEIVEGGIPKWLSVLAYTQSELYIAGAMPEGWLSTRAWISR